MFSKKEAQLLTTEFWTVFGKSFPKKWILYDTKIKDFSFKFYADKKTAIVSLDLEMKDESIRLLYLEKLKSLENQLKAELGNFSIFDEYTLENGKVISKIWVELLNVSLFDKNDWRNIFEFFVEKMTGFETVFIDFEDYIRDINF